MAGLGTSAITANSIGRQYRRLWIFPDQPYCLNNSRSMCGSGYYDGVVIYQKLMKITHLVMAGLNILIIFLIPVILKLYKVSDVTADIASTLMLYHCILSTFFWPPSFSLPNALRAASDVKFTMWVSMFSMWMWRIGFSYISIVFDMGVLGVWIAMTIDWVFRSACFIYRFKKEKYRKFTSI